MKKLLIIIGLLFIISCSSREIPTQFSNEALNETLTTLDENKITFQEILDKYKGKKIIIDIWASWCGDCIRGMPKIVSLQKEHPEAVYLFLSLDKTTRAWKNGIKKYNVKGEHYFIDKGYRGDFSKFIDIDWIPRYMVVNKNGDIDLFKAVKANDPKITDSLKK